MAAPARCVAEHENRRLHAHRGGNARRETCLRKPPLQNGKPKKKESVMALLQELFGGGNQLGGGGGMPMQMAVLGALTYRTVKGQGSLADMMGFVDGTPQTTQSSMGVQADTGGGMFSGLPGMLS